MISQCKIPTIINHFIDSYDEALFKVASYPKHPDSIVISKKENIVGLSREITEANIYDYYSSEIQREMIKELKGKNLFIVIKPEGILKPGQKPIYIRHPYHKDQTEFIRINNFKDFSEYRSGRAVEFHTTMGQQTDLLIIDFDAPGKFSQTTKITAEIYDAMEKIPYVKNVEARYTGKRGFHVISKLKKSKDINEARNFLKDWLKETFRDRNDVVIGESPKGDKGALGLSPMGLNKGHVAKWSMRVSGLCCIEVPRSKLLSFKREDASIDKTYKKITGNVFSFKSTEKKVASVITRYNNQDAVIVGKHIKSIEDMAQHVALAFELNHVY
jgi:DNA primase